MLTHYYYLIIAQRPLIYRANFTEATLGYWNRYSGDDGEWKLCVFLSAYARGINQLHTSTSPKLLVGNIGNGIVVVLLPYFPPLRQFQPWPLASSSPARFSPEKTLSQLGENRYFRADQRSRSQRQGANKGTAGRHRGAYRHARLSNCVVWKVYRCGEELINNWSHIDMLKNLSGIFVVRGWQRAFRYQSASRARRHSLAYIAGM